MKKPFSVGDRVSCYDRDGRKEFKVRFVGTEWLDVYDFDNKPYRYHVKQCRRLKKRERKVWYIKKQRMVYVRDYEDKKLELHCAFNSLPEDPENWIKCVEI